MSSAFPVETLSTSSDCAAEPIHIPGGIQPHGYLVSLDRQGRVAQVSANIAAWAKAAPESLVGAPLAQAIGVAAAAMVEARVGTLDEGEVTVLGNVEQPLAAPPGAPLRVDVPVAATSADDASAPRAAAGGHSPWAVVLHRHAGIDIVELERLQQNADVLSTMYPLVRTFLASLQRPLPVSELTALAAREIATITRFGRILVYSFDADGHGHVLAETVQPGYASYLGQRFPGSDIPSQARALYVRNRIRLIADADYAPQPLIPPRHPDTGAPTDLTLASLRSVSPVHIEYMRNMGTLASMSMSIVVGGELWGLISCHHATPMLPSFEVRTACEHIAQLLSLQIEARETQHDAAAQLRLRQTLSALLADMTKTAHFVDALRENTPRLLELTGAQGAAIVFEGRVDQLGNTPDEAEINRLVDWLVEQTDDVVHSDHIAGTYAAQSPAPEFAGFLAVSISKVFRNYVIWFRPEMVRAIEWAGDPRKRLAGLAEKLSPRESFETWTEIVRGRSTPWRPAEIEIATEFRTALLGIVLSRAEELGNLAMELSQANRELEEFSYTVSHDLRAPLRHIHSFAALLQEIDGERLSSRGRNFVDRIVSSADFGGRLVDDLLAFAQMGRAALDSRAVDMNVLVREIVDNERLEGRPETMWRIDDLPTVTGDVIFLRMALQNLISNAIKFTSNVEKPIIEIAAGDDSGKFPDSHVIYVKDNGAGFDMAYSAKLFRVFQRLHREEDFSGTGIGLANVRRIVERHGGSVSAEGVPGAGATFTVALPRVARPTTRARSETAAAAIARMAATGELRPTGGIRKKDSLGNKL